MNSLIILSICITIMGTSLIAAPLKDDEKIEKKPDIEDFIDRLLTSEKFEQLADKIAQRAADRIINLQQETSRDVERKPDKRARDDNVTKHQSNTHKTKNEQKEKQNDSDKGTEEKKENKNDKKRTKKLNNIPTIDTIAAIQKMSAFPTAELSLNYKHFTARETPSTKSSKSHQKSKEDNEEESHRKQKSNERDYEALPRAQLSDVSEFQAETKDENKKEDISLGINDKKESSEMKKLERKKLHKKDKKKNLNGHEKTESESGSSENDESSDSNESQFTTKSSQPLTKRSITKSKIIIKTDDSDEKDESDEADTTTPAILRSKDKGTVPFGFVDTEKSSQESESDDNKVSNIVDSAKLDEQLISEVINETEKSKEDTKSKEEKEKKDKEDIEEKDKEKDEKDKEKDEKGDKSKETEKKNYVIDTKHKLREKNGKLYAFAESPDYEEYHEKVASLLKSVKSNETKRNMVSKDLLDFVS